MVNTIVDKSAKILASVGAINLGTSEFLGFNVLSFVTGVWSKVAIAAAAISGGYLVYLLWNKKI